MPTFRKKRTSKASAADVFAVIAAVDRFAEWNPTIASARRLTGGPATAGSQFEFEIKGVGKTLQTIEEFEDGTSMRLVPSMKMMRGGHRFRLSEDDGATTVYHELEMTLNHVFKLMTPMVGRVGRRNMEATAGAQRAHLEDVRSTPTEAQ